MLQKESLPQKRNYQRRKRQVKQKAQLNKEAIQRSYKTKINCKKMAERRTEEIKWSNSAMLR